MKAKNQQAFEFTMKRIDWRMQQKFERPDFMTNIMHNSLTNGVTRDEIDFTLSILILAESEMTATALSATT